MKKVDRIFASRRFLRILINEEYILMIVLIVALCYFISAQAAAFHRSKNGMIVIDVGHGGVDGGAYNGALLEKDINLNIALKLRSALEQKGFDVIMTREEDISLDKLNNASSSRHERDLIARVNIINSSSALAFVSIHVDSNPNDPAENGSAVFYSKRLPENKALALCIQEELNKLTADGYSRKEHDPQIGRYYILGYSDIPGVLVESGFITNWQDRELLSSDDFMNKIAAAVADGVAQYVKGNDGGTANPYPTP